MWIQLVLIELGLVHKSSTNLRCDNRSGIKFVYNLMYHSKAKHIDLDTHYIRDLVVDGVTLLQ